MPNNNIKAFKAGAALEAHRFVKHNSADDEVIHAVSAADAVIGVTTEVGATSGVTTDVILDGWSEIKLGGSVTRGDLLVATADGKAIKMPDDKAGIMKPKAIALESGSADDIIQISMNGGKFVNVGVESFVADVDIIAGCVIKIGDSDTDCAKADTSTDYLMGIALNSVTAAGTCQVKICGIAEAIAGASVTRGQLVTSNTAGKVITAAPSAGDNCRVVGVALESGVLDDLVKVLISPGSTQG